MDAARLTPPRSRSISIASRAGAGEMAVLDFGDPKRPVDLVFVHANGFNARTYRSLLAPLASSLRILAPDLRGHGASTLSPPETTPRGWGGHGDDLAALLDTIEGPPVVLAGHSMGGTSSILAAAQRPSRVARIVALDPVIWRRWMVGLFQLPLADRVSRRNPLVTNALRRRHRFDSREQALEAYRGRGAFRGWSDTALIDYLAAGLVEDAEGLALACAPGTEAANYAAQSHDPWKAMAALDCPIRILKAEIASPCLVADRPRGLPHVQVEVVPGGTHFFPMLLPEVARDALFEAAV